MGTSGILPQPFVGSSQTPSRMKAGKPTGSSQQYPAELPEAACLKPKSVAEIEPKTTLSAKARSTSTPNDFEGTVPATGSTGRFVSTLAALAEKRVAQHSRVIDTNLNVLHGQFASAQGLLLFGCRVFLVPIIVGLRQYSMRVPTGRNLFFYCCH